MAMASEYRCVGCGFGVKSLFIHYSPGSIRLMKCGSCKEVADEYIECERMIIFIDIILHRPKVYRHVFYNAIDPETINIQHLLWKLVFAYLLLDSYRSLLLRRTNDESSIAESSVLIFVKKERVYVGDIDLELLQDLSACYVGMGIPNAGDLYCRYTCLNIKLHGPQSDD